MAWRANILTLLGHGEDDALEWELEREVDFVCGCALLVRREVLEEVGGFEPEWFAYFEDADLGVRARRAGWSSRVIGRAACLHDASASTGGGRNPRRKYMMGVNSVWFLRAHGRPVHWLRFLFSTSSRCHSASSWGVSWVRPRARSPRRSVSRQA